MSENNTTILSKVGLLLEKTREALIADLRQEFIGIRSAALAFEKEKTVDNFVPVIDAVFARVGYDISHYQELDEVRHVVEKLLGVTDKIAGVVKSGSTMADDGEISIDEVARLGEDLLPLIREVVELVKLVSDVEWQAVAVDLQQSSHDIVQSIRDEMFTREFARKVLDHVLMTLLKNARVVFKDEIEFARLTIESGVQQFVDNARDLAHVLEENVLDVVDARLDLIQDTMRETLADAADLYKRLGEQMEAQARNDLQTLAREYNATYVKIANGLSIIYSILDFLGIVESKRITLQLPDGLKEAVGKVQGAVDDVAGKIGAAVDTASPLVAQATSSIVGTLDEAMMTTRHVTGMGVAAAGTIGLQLAMVDDFMMDAATDVASGLATIEAAVAGSINEAANFKNNANHVAERFSKEVNKIKQWRYPVTITVVSWEKIEDLFTRPVQHFQALYPIDSIADVESLMTRIMGILHNINPNIPDFSSLKKMLEDLLRKLQQHILKKVAELKDMMLDAAGEVKKKIQQAINDLWNWFQPVVTTIRNVITMLKELATALKGEMKEVLEQVKEGTRLIAQDLQAEFDAIKDQLQRVEEAVEDSLQDASDVVRQEVNGIVEQARENINNISRKAQAFKDDIEQQVSLAASEAQDAVSGMAHDVQDTAGQYVNEARALWDELKQDMPRMPKLNLPRVVKTAIAQPMAECVNKTLKEVADLDLSSVINFGQERDELVACVAALKSDYARIRAARVNTVSLGLSEKDFTAICDMDFITSWKAALQLPDIPHMVQQVVVPDLQAWAWGLVSSVQTLVSPTVWKNRLDAVVTQLQAEFQNDLGNITGLISKEGALRLVSDASSVRDQLAANLNITDYITIIETAVDDVVLPDPEYYYTSFKQCVMGIITRLTACILQEVQRMRTAVMGAVGELKKIPDTIRTHVENLVGKLAAAEQKLAADLAAKRDEATDEALQLVSDIKATAVAILHVAQKIPATIDDLVDLLQNRAVAAVAALKTGAREALEKIAGNFLDCLEDLASELWRCLKNEYITPLLRAIKGRVVFFIKHVIKRKLHDLIDSITDLRHEAQSAIQSLLDNNAFFKRLHEAQVELARQVNEALAAAASTHHLIKQALPEGRLTRLNQLPALIQAIQDDEKLVETIFKRATLNIQTEIGAPDIIVPYYYITWVQNVLGTTVNYVQSDMGLKDILLLVQALYRGIPAEVKQHVAEVLPSLPSLPSNAFTDQLDDVTCSYDLDNMMCNVTLLDLKPSEDQGKGETLDWDASLKLQLFVMAGLYSKDGFVEKKDDKAGDDEASSRDKSPSGGDGDNDKAVDPMADAVPAIFFTLLLQGKVILTFHIGDNHHLTLHADGQIGVEKLTQETRDLSVGFCVSKKDSEKGITSCFHAFGSTRSLGGLLYGEFSRNHGSGSLVMIESQYLDVKMGNYPIGAYVLYNHNYPKFQFDDKEGGGTDVAAFLGAEVGTPVEGFTAGVMLAVKDFELLLKLRNNDFFSTLLKDDVSAKFDLPVAWDYRKGFHIDGGYAFHIDIDCDNMRLGPVKFSNLGVDLGCVKGNPGALQIQAAPSFSVELGDSVVMTIENLGVGLTFNMARKGSDGRYGLGDLDLDFNFKFPEGIGIAIDCPVVKGAALIGYDDVKKELFGAMELNVLEKFGVSALLMMTLGGHFSMVAMLSTRFNPGIPLGLGFSLTAVGGMLGLNRMLDYDAIRESVHSGTLESVFFVEDVMNHIDDMRKAADKIFPARRDQFFVGLLGQISYEPVVRCSFGLMFQVPDPASIIIVGAVAVGIQGTDVISIHVAFSGEIDFKRGLQFDASLYDSQIVGLRLEGDMAFRLLWGGPSRGFLMSVGGFHPAYRPEAAMHVSDLRRLSMKLDYSVLKVGMETYLAITSNTFQIGAHLDIKVGWDQFGITGYAGFDALFQFDPFMFMFDIEAGMAVMIGKARILSVDLALSLSGPRPWHARGSASFTFLFLPVDVSFDVSWGDKKEALPSKQIQVLKLLQEQIQDHNNWVVDGNSRNDRDVMLVDNDQQGTSDESKQEPLVLSPNGELSFSQSAVPMELDMQLCNNAVPTDYTEVVLDQVEMNNKPYQIINMSENHDERDDAAKLRNAIGQTIDADFAPALYLMMDNDEKLKSPSYVKYPCGFAMCNSSERTMGHATECDLGAYECFVRNGKTSQRASTDVMPTSSTGKRVAYQKNDKEAIERYVTILDTLGFRL